MTLWYGISEHEATWDDAVKYAEAEGRSLADVSPLYLLHLCQVLDETPGLDGSESFWVNRRRGWQDPGVDGWYFVQGADGHWKNRGLTVAVDRDPGTLRRFVYQWDT